MFQGQKVAALLLQHYQALVTTDPRHAHFHTSFPRVASSAWTASCAGYQSLWKLGEKN